MDWFSRAFIKASVTWLALGVTLGVAMAAMPSLGAFRTVHLHMNLLGFVAMMIFGVAYHVIPRFAGAPLHDRRLAVAHWWVANAGLVLMVAGFTLRATGWVPFAHATVCLAIGGTALALGAYAFAYNVWRTIGAGAPARARTQSDAPEAVLRFARRR
ncbi:MAG TPA: cbb3-type cytochrome c oxidase subunit I [Gemmatimonadaceae bacterium]|nr:cbb3-type cytochrome c oxidase subunit I [Gemmatimonadaceae bacterium]